MADSILLGHAPRPTTGAQLEQRIRTLIAAAAPAGAGNSWTIATELDGADVQHLHLDLTGFRLAAEQDRDRARLQPQGAQVSAEDAVLRELRVQANPMHVAGAAVRLEAELTDVSFRWIETDNGELAIELTPPDREHPLHGRASASVPKDQIGAAVLGLAETALHGRGVSVSKFDVDIQQTGERQLAVRFDAKVRKGLLGASVQGAANAAIDDNLGVTVSGIRVDSGNPLIAAMLSAVRGRIDRLEGRRIDLAKSLPEGITVADVQVRVTDEVQVEARLA